MNQQNLPVSGEDVEQYLIDKGLDAPRVTAESISARIVRKDFYVFPGTTTTIALITLDNGYNVVGHSACASPENFDEAVGRDLAYANAFSKIWDLEGYVLRERLSGK
jgi:hypothetical protein